MADRTVESAGRILAAAVRRNEWRRELHAAIRALLQGFEREQHARIIANDSKREEDEQKLEVECAVTEGRIEELVDLLTQGG